MKRLAYGVLCALLLGVLAACGRQLPEGGLPTAVREPTEPPTEVAVADAEVASDAPMTEEAVEVAGTEEATDTAEPSTAATEDAAEAPEDTDTAAEEVTVSGDPAAGEALFNEYIDAAAFSCANCHIVDSEERLVGPGMLGLSEYAADRVDGQSAAEYLRNSILHPNDYVVDTYPENLMPGVYADVFTEEQIDNLVAYLLTL